VLFRSKFCGFLSNGLRVQTDWGKLNALPCCLYPNPPIYFTDPEFDQKFTQINDQTHCTGCNHHYDVKKSLRGQAQTLVAPDAPNGAITYLELSIDIDCNAACLSCTDSYSSTWVAQNKKFKIKTVDDYPDPQDSKGVVDQLFARYDFSHLKQLVFFGGEPLKAFTTELFLIALCNKFDTSNIDLTFVTNASVPPTHVVSDLFKKFHKVNMNLSLDGIGQQFEYLRYPLKWDRVIDNISYLRTLDVDRFIVTATINPLNAYYCDRLINWAHDYFNGDRLHSIAFSKCNGIMSLSAIPPKLLGVVQKKYADHGQLSGMFSSIFSQSKNEMMKYIAAMDRNRKQSWQQIFPEMVEYFN